MVPLTIAVLALLPSLVALPSLMIASAEFDSEGVVERRQIDSKPWELQIEYSGKTFFDGWDFFEEPDPSNGLVNYVNSSTAFDRGLAFWTKDGIPGIQADNWSTLSAGSHRDSIRITTRQLFAGGVFIIDVKLMPWGCGVWPAFWTLGYNDTWPLAGEIDLISNDRPGCTVDKTPGRFSGQLLNPVCDRASGGTGCSIVSSSTLSFGEQFNLQGGGIYAMQWDGDGIKMWNWIRKDIPSDIISGHPTPSFWGKPVAAWGSATCDPFEYFKPQTLILNINLCGDWAGQLYHQFPYCPGSCAEHIANPGNLKNAIWLINGLRVYQREDQKPIEQQAPTNLNLTGSPGPVNFVSPETGNGTTGGADGQFMGDRGVISLISAVLVLLILGVYTY